MPALRASILGDGEFRLDGGAMFGVIPRVLWEKTNPPDEQNRILLGMHCLLVEGPDFVLLVDTGVGDKEDDLFAERYGFLAGGRLFAGLAERGMSPADVTHVINTHLHFDHCGGNTRLDAAGRARPSFPRARYIVPRGEWQDALAVNERTRGSYLGRNFLPVEEAGQLELVDGEVEVLPGVRLLPTPGHTRHHQSLLIDLGGRSHFYAADLIPLSSHLQLPWIMSYDLFPLETLETKRRLLARQREEGWLVCFEHEPGGAPCGELIWQATKKGEQPVFRPLSPTEWSR